MAKKKKYINKPVTTCTLLQIWSENKEQFFSRRYDHKDIEAIKEDGKIIAKAFKKPMGMEIINCVTNETYYRYDKEENV